MLKVCCVARSYDDLDEPLNICSNETSNVCQWLVNVLCCSVFDVNTSFLIFLKRYVDSHNFHRKPCGLFRHYTSNNDNLIIMKLAGFLSLFIAITLIVDDVSAWDQIELEIFDLVEEINDNFYNILKVDQVWSIQFRLNVPTNFNISYILNHCSKRHRLKFVKHSVLCRLCYIQTKTMPKMLTFSSEIWCQFMKCSKMPPNERSMIEVKYSFKRVFFYQFCCDFFIPIFFSHKKIQSSTERWLARLEVGSLLLSSLSQDGFGRNDGVGLCHFHCWTIYRFLGSIRWKKVHGGKFDAMIVIFCLN